MRGVIILTRDVLAEFHPRRGGGLVLCELPRGRRLEVRGQAGGYLDVGDGWLGLPEGCYQALPHTSPWVPAEN